MKPDRFVIGLVGLSAFVLTACTFGDDSPVCGDGKLEKGEVCDGDKLAHQTCELLGFELGGSISCRSDCSGFVTKECLGVFKSITTGGSRSCAIAHDDTVWCWGDNVSGQLGQGDAGVRNGPAQVNTLENITHVSAGWAYTCAITQDKLAWCWGSNDLGMLGTGGADDSPTPVQVADLTDVDHIDAGAMHTCAVAEGGGVWCWGLGTEGRLGNDQFTDSLRPTQASAISNATAVATGDWHNAAMTADGRAWCWGLNWSGEAGLDPDSVDEQGIPVALADFGEVIDVTTGYSHTCSATKDGNAWCWGENTSGQLGLHDLIDTHVPGQVKGLPAPVIDIAAGGSSDESQGDFFNESHTCAVDSDGAVWCWGANAYGQLGIAEVDRSPEPLQVPGLTNAVALDAGDFHTCALTANGRIWCWGENGEGQLGDINHTGGATPVEVKLPPP